jgi:hypothetical protein
VNVEGAGINQPDAADELYREAKYKNSADAQI